MPGIKQFLYGQLLETPPLPTTSLSGRTILITGANSGLGLEAAKHLLGLNASHIILACRSLAKADGAKAEILKSAPPANTQISCFAVQMDDFSSIASFAETLASAVPRLDTAILNAGVDLQEFTLSSSYETTLTVNVLGTFLLALLLLPKLRDTASQYHTLPRIAVVGSAVHAWANTKSLTSIPASDSIFRKLSEEEWSVAQKHAPMKNESRYFLSKLLVMLCVVQLAALVTKEESAGQSFVLVNNVAPGYCTTGLYRNDDGVAAKIGLRVMGRRADVGARTLVLGGCEAGREAHGAYLSEGRVKKMSGWCKSNEGEEMGARVWGEVMEVLEGVKGRGGMV